MFKIRPSVGADTTWLSKWPPSAVSLPPPLTQAFTCHGNAETIGWLSRNPTADKEAIANLLQLLSSQGSPEKPLESHRRRRQNCRGLLWPDSCSFQGSPLCPSHHHCFPGKPRASRSSAGAARTAPAQPVTQLWLVNRRWPVVSAPQPVRDTKAGCLAHSPRLPVPHAVCSRFKKCISVTRVP